MNLIKSVGKFLFSFLLPQKLNWKRNVVLAYNVGCMVWCRVGLERTHYQTIRTLIESRNLE